MEFEDYKLKLQELEKEFSIKKENLKKQYAFENNPYKIGDIVTDHIGSIKIESIVPTIPFLSNEPSCYYEGIELKKDLTPKKKGDKRMVYQGNIVS